MRDENGLSNIKFLGVTDKKICLQKNNWSVLTREQQEEVRRGGAYRGKRD